MNLRRRNLSFIRRAAMLCALALALTACGGGDDTSEPADAGADTAAEQTSDRPAWTDDDFERLIAREVDGYTITNARVSEFGNATVSYLEDEASTTVQLSALVTFQDCDPFLCSDLTAEFDDQRRENTRSLLPRIHIDNPDLVEEMGPAQLAGRAIIAIYFRSIIIEDDGKSSALTYQAITHDGANLITVQVSPDFASAGGLADSAEELAARMGPADGAAVAEDILTAFADELG